MCGGHVSVEVYATRLSTQCYFRYHLVHKVSMHKHDKEVASTLRVVGM